EPSTLLEIHRRSNRGSLWARCAPRKQRRLCPRLLRSFLGALAENCSSQTHLRCTFLNGNLEIMAHAHRQLWKRAVKLLFEIVAQPSQPSEIMTRIARIFAEWWNCHQATEFKMRHLPNGFGEGRKVGLRDARFFFGGVELHLDQHREPFVRFARGIVKLQRQSCVVNGIDPVKQARSAACFIALQMPDQMPA